MKLENIQVNQQYRFEASLYKGLNLPLYLSKPPNPYRHFTLKEYPTWDAAHDAIIQVDNIVEKTPIVHFIDVPTKPFRIAVDYIGKPVFSSPAIENEYACACKITLLMNRGCQCGAFKNENS
jgi:hypothetical protein